jgi:hypothetical protein
MKSTEGRQQLVIGDRVEGCAKKDTERNRYSNGKGPRREIPEPAGRGTSMIS